ncbi:MAG: DUF5028 domain-containing protein [Coriobacteriaceae bacterium]|nr:DUF5028 domain-containing protein [Coriobacteriaceae bacterium]
MLAKGPSISRRSVIVAGIAACGIGLGLRIKSVNENCTVIPEREYGMNEWLELDDNFLGSEVDRAPGYGFMVSGCSVMTPNEYLKAYSRTDLKKLDSDDADRPSIAVVDMKVRNEGTSDNGIKMFTWHLASLDHPNKMYEVDFDLLGAATPEIAGSVGFIVDPGVVSRVIHFPFATVGGPDYFHEYDDTYRPDIQGRRFRLIMTNLPERRMFVLDANDYDAA